MAETVGWIGVGSIGHRMARNLAKAGYHLIVADAGSTALAPEGSTIAASNADVAAGAETIILSLPDGKITEAVCREIAAAPNRRVTTVIDTSTIGIEAARTAHALLAAQGVDFVDAPVSGGIAGADRASLSVMMGCSPEAYAHLAPMLKNIGQNVFHVGTEPGHGQTVKLLNNFLSATAMAATSEAVAFGTAQGLDMRAILEVVKASSGNNTAVADKFPNRIANEAYDGGFSTVMMAKDVRLYVENVQASGTADRIGNQVRQIWAGLQSAQPDSDFTLIYPHTRDGHTKG